MGKEKETVSYGFYSKLLKKPFDRLDELKEAEAEYNKAHAAELKAKEERKVRAQQVEEAYMALQETYAQARAIVDAANKEASQLIKNAEGRFTDLRNNFVKDYGSFHMSYTDHDGKKDVTVSDIIDEFFKVKLW